MEINNSVDKEGDAGPKHIEAEQKSDNCAADKATKHWNEAEYASD